MLGLIDKAIKLASKLVENVTDLQAKHEAIVVKQALKMCYKIIEEQKKEIGELKEKVKKLEETK